MHSSCIVVRLDWAAGLPAWLIRRSVSPDLTSKTLFSSQKHQSHSSWDLNEDSWLTLSMNLYQVLDIARRYTNLQGMHQSYWQSLARLCSQCHFVVSSLEIHCGECTTIPLISLLCWDHRQKLAGKHVLESAMAEIENYRIHTSSTTLSVANCWWSVLLCVKPPPPLHWDYI